MALKLIGAGMGRTGTLSLKIALTQLLNAPCYHMTEVFDHPEDIPTWDDAAHGREVDWNALFEGYSAAVDWPSAAYWREISQAFPDALILLTLRDPDSWWKSANATIFQSIQMVKEKRPEWYAMISETFRKHFTMDIQNKDAAIAAFNRNNEAVLQEAPKDRLLVWTAGDGWEPLCNALGVPVPDMPFPRANTTEEFVSRVASLHDVEFAK
jgi:hypothetical protein